LLFVSGLKNNFFIFASFGIRFQGAYVAVNPEKAVFCDWWVAVTGEWVIMISEVPRESHPSSSL
jgi:hypothetical protein